MSITRNLLGAGTGPQQAKAIVGVSDRNKTATGTNRVTAYIISEDVTTFSTVPVGAGATLRADSLENDVYTVVNNGADALNVYPPNGGTIGNGAVDAAYTIEAGTFVDFQAMGNNTFIVRADPLSSLAAPTGDSLIGHIDNGIGATPTTVQDELRAANQYRSGNFYSHAGAKINRFNDRVFIGQATINDAAMPNVTRDWLTDFQVSAGLSNGSIVSSQSAVLTDTNNQANVAFLAGSQSLNFISAGAACIGNASFVVNNNASLATKAWGYYGEAHKINATSSSVYGMELDTRTLVDSIEPNSYQQGNVIGFQVASGCELSAVGQFDASAAIQIESNPKKFKVGINFGSTAITGTDGVTGTGTAIALAKGHEITWSRASGVNTAKLGASSATQSVWVDFADDKMVIKTLGGTTLFELSTAGRVGIGSAPTVGRTLELTKAVTGSTIGIGVRSAGVAQSDVTSEYRLFATSAATQAAVFSVTSVSHYNAAQGTFGAGSIVTEQAGFLASSTLVGATSNFGFQGLIPSGSGRWNLYMSGTANNAIQGNAKFGAVTTPTAKVDIAAGTANAGTAPLKLAAGTNLTTPENGALEFDGTNLYFTVGGVRKTVTLV